MKILGIDPGLSGALALIEDGRLLDTWDMPVAGSRVAAGLLIDLFHSARPDLVVIEEVHSMPGQGVSSTFKFGLSAGVVDGAVAALGYGKEYVQPTVWKRALGLAGKEKDDARLKALDLWPSRAQLFARKKDCGRADAALIALWNHRQLLGVREAA